MTIRKISDIPKSCTHEEHNPPAKTKLPDGIYEHKCPGCGYTVIGRVERIRVSERKHNTDPIFKVETKTSTSNVRLGPNQGSIDEAFEAMSKAFDTISKSMEKFFNK